MRNLNGIGKTHVVMVAVVVTSGTKPSQKLGTSEGKLLRQSTAELVGPTSQVLAEVGAGVVVVSACRRSHCVWGMARAMDASERMKVL